jgi:hypothetical protein
MDIDLIAWDDEEDPGGNVQHILGPGEVTLEEVEDVLRNPESEFERSRSSDNFIAFGTTASGKRIAVVFSLEDHPTDTIVRPVTAFEVPEYGEADNGY